MPEEIISYHHIKSQWQSSFAEETRTQWKTTYFSCHVEDQQWHRIPQVQCAYLAREVMGTALGHVSSTTAGNHCASEVLANVALIVKTVSVQLWQYTESWTERQTLYEQLLDIISFSVLPQAKVNWILRVWLPDLCYTGSSLVIFRLHEGSWKISPVTCHWLHIIIMPIKMFVCGWGAQVGGQ